VSVSGGKPDGTAEFPHYRYGGMWKNKRAEEPVSAKIKGAAKNRAKQGKGKGKEEIIVEGTGSENARRLKKDAGQGSMKREKRQDLEELDAEHYNEDIHSDNSDDNLE